MNFEGNFIDDFTYISTNEIKLDAEVVIIEPSLDLCGAACVSSQGFNCKSFDFCPESQTCLLNSGQVQKLTLNEIRTDICGHYRSKIKNNFCLLFKF